MPLKPELETRIESKLAAGDEQGALTEAIEGYGPEILGFLCAMTDDPDAAGEIFLMFSEDMVRGLQTYRAESPFRSWAYAVARGAMRAFFKKPHNQARRRAAMSEVSAISLIAVRVRTDTLPYLRTQVKDAFRSLRDHLEPDDRAMLVLRVDRKMSWREVAQANLPIDPPPSRADIDRKASQLRKRFERVKDELRALGRAQGLI